MRTFKIIGKTSLVLVLVAFISGCNPSDRYFNCYLRIENRTASEVVLEIANADGNISLEKIINPNNYDVYFFGEYEGKHCEKKPSDEFVTEGMKRFALYRVMGGEKQYISAASFENLPTEIRPREAFYDLAVTDETFNK